MKITFINEFNCLKEGFLACNLCPICNHKTDLDSKLLYIVKNNGHECLGRLDFVFINNEIKTNINNIDMIFGNLSGEIPDKLIFNFQCSQEVLKHNCITKLYCEIFNSKITKVYSKLINYSFDHNKFSYRIFLDTDNKTILCEKNCPSKNYFNNIIKLGDNYLEIKNRFSSKLDTLFTFL